MEGYGFFRLTHDSHTLSWGAVVLFNAFVLAFYAGATAAGVALGLQVAL